MKKKAKTTDIKFRKQSNAMERTSEKAPYLGKVELKGTVYEDAFIDEMVAQGCTESAASIRRIIHAGDAVTARILGENGQKVQTGDGLVMPHIAGSFPTPDANPGAGNELVPRIDLGDNTRDMLSGVKPTEDRAGIADLGGVRILSVFTEGIGFGQLKGTQPFGIAGVGFKPSASSSAAVKVVNAKTGVETEAAEVTVVDNQNITAELGEVLPKGKYKVVVKVSDEGGVSGNDEASYNVKMLAAPAPVPPPKKTLRFYPTAIEAKAGGEGLAEVNRADNQYVYLVAEGEEIADGDTFAATLTPNGGGEPLTATVTVERSEATDDVAHAALPFCEPLYADVYGTLTVESATTKREIPLVPVA